MANGYSLMVTHAALTQQLGCFKNAAVFKLMKKWDSAELSRYSVDTLKHFISEGVFGAYFRAK